MSPHSLLPLVAFFLNVSLAGLSLLRNPGSRLNRVFAYFASGMALWNFGVFLLRTSPDEWTAYFVEIIIHIGVIALPAFYYHFVLIFLDSTTRHRPSLVLAYLLAFIYELINLSGTPLFMSGVKATYWGWAPATGPLYAPYLLIVFNGFMIYGVVLLVRAHRGIDSSFRRNRGTLDHAGDPGEPDRGLGGLRALHPEPLRAGRRLRVPGRHPRQHGLRPDAGHLHRPLPPLRGRGRREEDGRLRAGGDGPHSSSSASLTTAVEDYFQLKEASALWLIVPLGAVVTVLVSPIGRNIDDRIQRMVFSKRQGCYETLLQLSKRMSSILNFNELVDTLVHGLVRGIPATHATLMIHDPATGAFLNYREDTTVEEGSALESIRADSPIAQWLTTTEGLLVKEEVKLNPLIARYFETAEGELESIKAALIVPLKVENKLNGILLLGEKLSGEIYDDQELEMLLLLATQAAISLENARLYEGLATSNARLLEASRLKSQFLANMSHELRTPLNSIIGFSKVLLNRLDGDLNERQDAYVRSVHNSSRHLLELINSILDFSRIEAGRFEMRPEMIDLHDIVEECLQSSMPLVRDKRVKLERDVPVELPPVHADRTRVKQVLLNLLSNAIKFTHSGRVLIQVRHDRDVLHVSVADTGIGISPGDLQRLFEPFQRLDNPLAQQADGTGLGLAISKKFIELHRGRIWAESRESQGSTFHFTLPLTAAQA